MGQSSQAGQFGLGVQATKGTAVAATRFARIRGGSIGGDRSLLIPDPEIGGNRDIQNAMLGGVAFSGDIDFYPRAQMLAMLIYGAFGGKASTNNAGATNEVQTVTITGAPTGGTFTLSFNGAETSALAHNVASADVQTALRALATIGSTGVTVTGIAGGPYTVTFTGALAAENVPLLVASSSLTGGTAPTVTVATTTSGAATVGTHVLTPANTLPWLTVEERLGDSLESFRYTDARINSFRLEADANGYLMGSANIIALIGQSGFAAQVAPEIDETPLIVGSSVIFTVDGVDLRARSFSLEFSNNMENDDFRLGSVFLGDAVPKRRELKIGANYRPDDSTLWKRAMWGSDAVTTAQPGAAYRGPVGVTIESYETIGNVVGGTKYSTTFQVPSAVLAPFKINPNGDDVIGADIEFTAIRPFSGVPLVTTTVVNDLADVA